LRWLEGLSDGVELLLDEALLARISSNYLIHMKLSVSQASVESG